MIAQPKLRRIALGVILLASQPHGPVFAQQTDSLDPRKSLFITDRSLVAAFRFERVMSALVRDTPNTTPLMLFRQMIDTQNPAPGLSGITTGPFCDDEQTDGRATRDGFPIECPSLEGVFATSNPFVDYPEDPIVADAGSNNAFIPIALVNRFDLALADGSTCGRYSIIFARRAGVLVSADRFLIALEAEIPNPTPAMGLAACRPIAQLWANLSKQSLDQRRFALEQFYFSGIDPFPAVVSAANFAPPGGGRIRTNQFHLVGKPSGVPFQAWRLYQFQLVQQCHDTGVCEAQMIPRPLPGTPSARLLNTSDNDSRGGEFREQLLSQLPGLLGRDLARFSVEYSGKFLMFESNAFDQGIDHQIPLQFKASLNTAEGQRFANRIQEQLTIAGSGLTPEQVVNRAWSQSCGGCHNTAAGADIGDGAIWPKALQFTHVGEQFFEFENGEEGPGTRYGISPAVREFFLPSRLRNLQNFLLQTQ